MEIYFNAEKPVMAQLAIDGDKPDKITTADDLSMQMALITALKNGVVMFKYEKVDDGSIRSAIGTLRADLLPEKAAHTKAREFAVGFIRGLVENLSNESYEADPLRDSIEELQEEVIDPFDAPKAPRKDNPGQVKYYDLGKSAWRSVRAENILTIYLEI